MSVHAYVVRGGCTIGDAQPIAGGAGFSVLTQSSGFLSSLGQIADHAETNCRCSGRLHEATGSNIASWSTNSSAYFQ